MSRDNTIQTSNNILLAKYYSGSWFMYFYQFVLEYVTNKAVFRPNEIENWINKYSICALSKVFPVTTQSDIMTQFSDFDITQNEHKTSEFNDPLLLTYEDGFIIPESLKRNTYLFVFNRGGLKQW